MNNSLLLLHGALGSKEQFKGLKELLNTKFELYEMNFEGHGSRASNKAFSIDLFSDNVIDFLNENEIDKVDVFGYSMGGYVALNLANQAPHYINRIITLGTKFDWSAESAAREVKMLNPEVIEEKVPAFANNLQSTHSANNWKAVVNKTAKMMLKMGSGKRLSTEDLNQIRNDVLICIGTEDNMVSIEESKKSSLSLPNGTLKLIDNFKHQFGRNDMVILASIIEKFLIR